MPAIRNTGAHNLPPTFPNPLRLPCTFKGCRCTFRSKSGLTQHIHTCHQYATSSPSAIPAAGPSHLSLPFTTLMTGLSSPEDNQLQCPVPECRRSFKNRAGLTLHARLFHRASVEPSSPVLPTDDPLAPEDVISIASSPNYRSLPEDIVVTASSPNYHSLPCSSDWVENWETHNVVHIIPTQLIILST